LKQKVTKKEKIIKSIAWILLTVVPGIFGIFMLIFGWGFNAKGYISDIDIAKKNSEEAIIKIGVIESYNILSGYKDNIRDEKILKLEKINSNLVDLIQSQQIQIEKANTILTTQDEINQKFWNVLNDRLDRIENKIHKNK